MGSSDDSTRSKLAFWTLVNTVVGASWVNFLSAFSFQNPCSVSSCVLRVASTSHCCITSDNQRLQFLTSKPPWKPCTNNAVVLRRKGTCMYRLPQSNQGTYLFFSVFGRPPNSRLGDCHRYLILQLHLEQLTTIPLFKLVDQLTPSTWTYILTESSGRVTICAARYRIH